MDRHRSYPRRQRDPFGWKTVLWAGLILGLLGSAGYIGRLLVMRYQVERFNEHMNDLQRDLQAQAAAADRRHQASLPRMLPGSVDPSRPIGSEACVAGTVAVRVENGWSQRPGPEPCRVGSPPR